MTKTFYILIILSVLVILTSCNKDYSTYLIGEWAIDSISYRGNSYMDSLNIRFISFEQGTSKVFFPFKSSKTRRIKSDNGFTSYFTYQDHSNTYIGFDNNVPELAYPNLLEFRNDTLRHCMLLIIKNKELYIRAIRYNFIYDSPSGFKIVDKFEKWPKKGEYQFVPLPDSVLR